MMREPVGERVADRRTQEPVDYATLAEFLVALGYPTRLELLDQLRFPHTLGEIRLAPHRASGGSPDRPAAKQTVQAHLDKLVEVGLVRTETVEQQGRDVPRYTVNPQKVYLVTEELRRLSTRYAGRGLSADATGTLAHAPTGAPVKGPRLLLVHGVYEGKAFPLDAASAEGGAWVIGRRAGLAVSLDYDPFISTENSVVRREGSAYTVTDLKESKNGTSVNWEPLARGATRTLETGDVIGVGRSLLSFLPT
jgi:DNA-binding transcriptional ArsR family regulator